MDLNELWRYDQDQFLVSAAVDASPRLRSL